MQNWGKLSRATKLFQIELRLGNQISRIIFVRLHIFLFEIDQKSKVFNVFFLKTHEGLQLEHSELCSDIRAVWLICF